MSVFVSCRLYIDMLTGSILPEEKHAAEEDAVLHLALFKRKERLPESRSDGDSIMFDLSIYGIELFHDICVVLGKVTDPA